jgi:cytochrome c-type biogenesis protein CcmF
MIISHLGIGLLILGITGSSVWQKEKIIRMKVNNKIEIQNYLITFEKINEIVGPNYVALKGIFLVTDKNGRLITRLKPESRFYPITNNYTTETSINTNLIRDLYIVLGEGNLNKGWIVRIYLNPLVAWIWIGGFTIFFGGLVSMRYNFKNFKDQKS